LGSVFSVETPAEEVLAGEVFVGGERGEGPSRRLLESGTEPVSRTVRMPRVSRVKPRQREK
jgi:hypothetical protein